MGALRAVSLVETTIEPSSRPSARHGPPSSVRRLSLDDAHRPWLEDLGHPFIDLFITVVVESITEALKLFICAHNRVRANPHAVVAHSSGVLLPLADPTGETVQIRGRALGVLIGQPIAVVIDPVTHLNGTILLIRAAQGDGLTVGVRAADHGAGVSRARALPLTRSA